MTKKIYNASDFNINKLMIHDDALFVIEKLQNNGYDGFIVGGGIRDLLLGIEPKDFDVVTNATPEEVHKLFRNNSIIIGRRFKIVHVYFKNINPNKMINNRPIFSKNIIEISTYRSKKIPKQNIDSFGRITIDNNYGTQSEDAYRRDFTINAMYYDPIKGIIIDYINGMEDIKKHNIKIIGNPKQRYIEDPVRFLRAIRLSEKLKLNIDPQTIEPFHQMKHLLCNESNGRLYEETLKILLSGYSVNCINKLKELKLPKGVFVLFDKLFFKKNIDKFAFEVLKKTDQRLKDAEDISIVFILSGLLWNLVYQKWQKLLNKTNDSQQSLLNSITNIKESIYSIGITKQLFKSMREVWNMQLQFESPNIQKIDDFIKMPRFRQGLHLFNIRYALNQINEDLYQVWNDIANLINSPVIDNSAKEILVKRLELITQDTQINKTQKRTRRKKGEKQHDVI